MPLIFSRNPQSVAFQRRALRPGRPPETVHTDGRSAMRSKDLMCPDLLSEIVLLGFGTLIFVSLLLFIVAAFART